MGVLIIMEDRVIKAVRLCTVKQVNITAETSLRNDLGFDSFDTLMLISELEGEFNINIDENDFDGIDTISDITERLNGLGLCWN